MCRAQLLMRKNDRNILKFPITIRRCKIPKKINTLSLNFVSIFTTFCCCFYHKLTECRETTWNVRIRHMATLWLTPVEHLPFRNKKGGSCYSPCSSGRTPTWTVDSIAGRNIGAWHPRRAGWARGRFAGLRRIYGCRPYWFTRWGCLIPHFPDFIFQREVTVQR